MKKEYYKNTIKHPVKFCIKCDRAWERYTDGNMNQGKYQKVVYYNYMKNLSPPKKVCPKCKEKKHAP